MIIDRHNRVHDYLRISLTDNCNLRCFYCMPDEEYEFTPASRLMQHDEIYELAKIFTELGVKKIRLTGGEPLVRKDAEKIIRSLATLPVKLTLTTNATRLHDFKTILKEAGLRSLNISLDTLDAERFHFMTKRNVFKQVKQNIDDAISDNFIVKVNMVVMKGINENEIIDFVEWTRDVPVHVRFIEFMPFSGNRWNSGKVFSLNEMLQMISEKYEFSALQNEEHDTAKHYQATGHKGTFAVISTMSEPFCGSCNRIRLTADGKLKNCLFSTSETDLLTPFRNRQDIVHLIKENVMSKEKELGGQFDKHFERLKAEKLHNRSMITIGG